MPLHMLEAQIDTFRTQDQAYFLQASPEYGMKILLARGSDDIYQICKACRKEQQGKLHNNEFTIIEWYRKLRKLDEMISETLSLINTVTKLFSHNPLRLETLDYGETFRHQELPDPWSVTTEELTKIAEEKLSLHNVNKDIGKSALLDLVFSRLVMPAFKDSDILWAVKGYPADYAAFARREGEKAQNFEIFWQGIELAHGCKEENDMKVLRKRFPDQELQWKMLQGMPQCAGVALGFDRLFMLAAKKRSLNAVIFPYQD